MPTLNGDTVPHCGVLNVYAEGSPTAWGARLIVNQDGYVDFVPDRQGAAGVDRPEFLDRLNDRFDLQALKTALRNLLLDGKMHTRTAETFILHKDDDIIVHADTRGSGGYCYVIAVARTPDSDAVASRLGQPMEMKPVDEVTTAGEATDLAIEWQHWMSDQSLSWGDLADWQGYFTALADKFDLHDEFKENGIV